MLFSPGNELIRLQCGFVDTPEVDAIADFIGSQRGYPSAFLLPEYINFFTKVHNISHYVLYVLLSLHLTAIFYYQFFKKNKIIQQFIDGYARDDEVENKPIIKNSMKGIYLLLILIFLPVILLWYL